MRIARRTAMNRSLLAVLGLSLALSACSNESETRAVDPSGESAGESSSAAGMPTGVPAAVGEVTTDGLVTVLDDGSDIQMCTFVAKSLPPQCSGSPLADWDWAAHPEHEDVGGTKWGDFALTGTFDGTTLSVTEAIPAALYDVPSTPPVGPDFETPCKTPAGGWVVVDAASATPESMDATLTVAAQLPGYADAWLDQSINPAFDSEEPGDDELLNDPTKLVLNVAVTKDVAGAEAKLRETWGGALCVSEATRTDADLTKIATELQQVPGVTSAAAVDDVVQLGVLFDDGSFQDWADETYGAGRVEVSSTLLPIG